MHIKRILQSIIQNHVTKCEKHCFSGSRSFILLQRCSNRKHWCNHGVNQRQATTANKHGNSTLYSVLFTIYRFYAHWRRPCGGVQRVSRRHGTVPRARRQPRPKYRYPLYLTGGYKSEQISESRKTLNKSVFNCTKICKL